MKMDKSMKKKKVSLPLWVPVVTIVVVLTIIAVIFMKFGNTGQKQEHSRADLAQIQAEVNRGMIHPYIPRFRLEKMGIKYPANYDELVNTYPQKEGPQTARYGFGASAGPAGSAPMPRGR